MKKLLIALAAVFITAAASYGQGTVNFATRVGTAVNAPVTIMGSGAGLGSGWSAQLFLSQNGSLTALVPATTFRDPLPTAPTADQYVNNVTVEVPGVASGSPATLVMRAWATSLGSTYDAAVAAGMGGYGESAPVTVNVGGGIAVPANLVGLQGFNVMPIIPEPSILALGALGASALLLRRRK